MTRRSELQRKLESLPAPKPPANLAERIKSEIPKDLRFNAEEERERLSGGIALNLRVAASILVLIATAYLALHVMTRTKSFETAAPVSNAGRSTTIPLSTSTAASASAAERVAISEPAVPQVSHARQTKVAEVARLEAKPQKKDEAQSTAAPRASNTATAAVAESVPMDEVATAGKVADAVAVPAAPVPPPPPVAAPAASEKIVVVQAEAPAVAQSRRAMAKSNALQDARRRDLDLDVVQRFSMPDTLPAGAVLDVEAVEEPIAPRRIVVRASFDAGIVVHDLWVDTIVSRDAPSARSLAASMRWGAASFSQATRTALTELALPSSDDAPLVTIRAHYRVGDDPIEQSVEKVVRRSDVRAWSVASKRMKSATLAGMWASGSEADAVQRLAREAGLSQLADAIAAAR